MIMYRPHRGTLVDAMAEKREFKSLKDCLETLINEHNQTHRFQISMHDICILNDGQDERVGWHDMFVICCRSYSEINDKEGYLHWYGDKYDHPLRLFGYFTTDYLT